MRLTIIVATDPNALIGMHQQNHAHKLPWHCAEDMKFFKEQTTGQNIIMGANTYYSLPKNLTLSSQNKPLPKRNNFVVSKTYKRYMANLNMDTSFLFDSLGETLSRIEQDPVLSTNKTFIIGGAQLYNAAIDNHLVDTILLTVMNKAAVVVGSGVYWKTDWHLKNEDNFVEDASLRVTKPDFTRYTLNHAVK